MATVLLLGTETPLLEGLVQTLGAHGHAAWAIHEPTDLLAAARAAGPVLLLVERTLLLDPDIAHLLPMAIGHTTIITFRNCATPDGLARTWTGAVAADPTAGAGGPLPPARERPAGRPRRQRGATRRTAGRVPRPNRQRCAPGRHPLHIDGQSTKRLRGDFRQIAATLNNQLKRRRIARRSRAGRFFCVGAPPHGHERLASRLSRRPPRSRARLRRRDGHEHPALPAHAAGLRRRPEGATTTWCSPAPTSSSEIHESFLAVGCDVVETCTFQAHAAPTGRVGPGRPHGRDQRAPPRNSPAPPPTPTPRPSSRASSPAPSAPPACSPSSNDPTLGNITFDELVENFHAQAGGARGRRRRRAAHRDGAGHPRGQGRASSAFERLFATSAAACRCRPRSRSTSAAACSSAPTSPARMTTLEAMRRRRDRPQLLHRPRAHARADPLSGRARERAALLHPERRACRSTRGRRGRLPAGARADGRARSPSSCATSACASWAAAAARRPSTWPRSWCG